MRSRIVAAALMVAALVVPSVSAAHSHRYWARHYGHRMHLKALARIEAQQDRMESTASSTVPASALAVCIIDHESTGNPQAVNGKYHGLAQWSADAWRRSGGLQYASDPLFATRGQQVAVLNHALAIGMENEWRPYDHC